MAVPNKYESAYITDLVHCERWVSSIDQDKFNKCQKLNQKLDDFEANKYFFKKIQEENIIQENKKFFFEFNDFIIFFNLNDASFSFKLKNASKNTILFDNNLLSKAKSPFIFSPNLDESEKANIFPFRFGSTLEKIIKDNKKSHVLEEADLILLSIEVTIAMRDFYNTNSDNNQYSHRKISDCSFFIDYMKNAYLFSISNDNMNSYFNTTQIEDQKGKDIYTLKCLLEEIFRETSPSDPLRGNQNFVWYKNNHEELNKIIGKFKNKYKDFDEIIADIKDTSIYKRNSDQIEERLQDAIKNTRKFRKSTFFESILSEWSLNYDIKNLYNRLFIQLRDSMQFQSEYFLFFNLVLHIFFPTTTINDRSIDYTNLLEVFDVNKELLSIIKHDLLQKNLPNEEIFKESVIQVCKEITKSAKTILNEEDTKEILSLLDKNSLIDIIQSELSNQNYLKNQKLCDFLKKVYFYYFPGNKIDDETIKSQNYILDYFGIIRFIVDKDDIIYITHPKISDINMERMNSLTSEKQLSSFFRNSFENSITTKVILETVEGFDFTNASHKLLFNFDDSSFYVERLYKLENDSFRHRVEFQDEIFKKIESNKDHYDKRKLNTKYLLHLNDERNKIKHTNYSAISVFPMLTYPLNRIIQQNGKKQIIYDSDKILWAIQIAYALEAVIEIEKENLNGVSFKKSIHDQFFYVDSLKNIYLSALAFNTESDNESSTSNPHLYFCIENDSNCIYKYGVLLFEIFAEIEPINLFGNESRDKRISILEDGYSKFDLFNKYKEKVASIYGDEIGSIIDRCVDFDRPDKFNEFSEIIEELKNTKIYQKYKFAVDKREKEANPIDSSYKCSFKSLLLSGVTGMRDPNQILKKFDEKMIEMSPKDEIQSFFQFSYQYLTKGKPQGCFFDAVNRFSYDSGFYGDIESLLSKIVSRIFYQNKGKKAVILNEAEIQKLGYGVGNLNFFNQMTKFVKHGISPFHSNETTFSEDSVLRCSEKVPIVSLDYYIEKNFANQDRNKWVYQIIYAMCNRNFVLSADEMSYDIKLSDFALFYNNLTGQFDVDLNPSSETEIKFSFCSSKVNVYSFAKLIRDLIKGEYLTYDFDDLFEYEFDTFNQFISCCLLLNEKKVKKQYKLEKLFESFLKSGFIFYDVLFLYENQLKEQIGLNDFNEIADISKYADQNYRILNSKLGEIMNFFSEDNDRKFVSGDSKSGYFLYYEKTKNKMIDLDDIKCTILSRIFPQIWYKDAISKNGNMTYLVKVLLEEINESDEIKFHGDKSDDNKLSLIMKVFPDEDLVYLYKIFHLNDQKLYDTLEFLIKESENEPDFNNYDEQMDIECLLINFPQIKLNMIDSMVNEKVDLIEKFVEKNDDEYNEKINKNNSNKIVIEIPKKFQIKKKAQLISNELKNEIKKEFKKLENLDEMTRTERDEIEKKMRRIRNDDYSKENETKKQPQPSQPSQPPKPSQQEEDQEQQQDEIQLQLQAEKEKQVAFFISFMKKEIFHEIHKKSKELVSIYYAENDKDFFKTTNYLVNKFNKFEFDFNYEISSYADQIMRQYGHPFVDKVINRTLEIYSDLDQKSYMFLIKRYINQLNPKFNYELTLKIQNIKNNISRNITLDELKVLVAQLPYPIRSEGGNIKITIDKTVT